MSARPPAYDISLRRLGPEHWAQWRLLRLAALSEAPYAFGSTLAEWQGAGEQRWRERLSDVPLNLVANLGDHPVGLASATTPERGEAELISMWACPEARGRGVGDALIAGVMGWAWGQGASSVGLDVRAANHRAIALYERNGFVDVGPATEEGGPYPERRMARPVRRPA
jgi:ribosomal protein S18 acetylase RimI-like enzyme